MKIVKNVALVDTHGSSNVSTWVDSNRSSSASVLVELGLSRTLHGHNDRAARSSDNNLVIGPRAVQHRTSTQVAPCCESAVVQVVHAYSAVRVSAEEEVACVVHSKRLGSSKLRVDIGLDFVGSQSIASGPVFGYWSLAAGGR